MYAFCQDYQTTTLLPSSTPSPSPQTKPTYFSTFSIFRFQRQSKSVSLQKVQHKHQPTAKMVPDTVSCPTVTAGAATPPGTSNSSSLECKQHRKSWTTNETVHEGEHPSTICRRLRHYTLFRCCLRSSLVSHHLVDADRKHGFQTESWQLLHQRHQMSTLNSRHLLARPIVQRSPLW